MLRRALLLGGAGLAAGATLFYLTLPDVAPLEKAWPKTTAFMERRKIELSRRGESTRLEWTPVPLSRVAPALRRAAVVAEDARFWSHGAEAASRRYFGKSAAALSASEAATLAAIIPSPRIDNPARQPRRVELRARRILRRM